ncbi:MAG: AsmA-like C-terminal region-containing protein, partial [Fibrobacterota bacterium]
GVQIHDVLVGVKDRLPEGTPRKFHDKLYGKGNATVSARVKAPIREASKKLSADIVGSFMDGKVVNFPALASMMAKAHKLAPSIPATSDFAFSTMTMKARLEEGKILLQDMQMDGSSLGMVQANGSIGIDQALDLKVDTHLPDAASSAMQSGAGAAVAATGPVAAALGMNAGSPLPTDDKKRVVLSWLVTGSFADPSVSYNLPRIQDLAKGAAAALANEAKAKAEAFAKEQTDKLKAEAEARARSEAAKVKAEAEKKATEVVKEKAGEQGAKAVDALKKKVKLPW